MQPAPTATITNPTTVAPTFTPDVAGSYIAQLIVTDTRGGVSSAATAVITASNPIAITNNAFTTACSGANCAATSSTQYAGSGTGLWRYSNTASTDATINIDFSGVSAGKKVTLAFTNGNSTSALNTPQAGTQMSTEPALSAMRLPTYAQPNAQTLLKHKAHDHAHGAMLQRQQQTANSLRQMPKINPLVSAQAGIATPPVRRAAPALNANRTWYDTIDNLSIAFPSTNKHVCSLPSGRNVVFWQSNSDTNLSTSDLAAFTTSACGTNGGFARLNALVGDFWGAHSYGNLISDTAALQDVNVVFIDSASTQGWAGYFDACNNFTTAPTNCLDTNKSLAFFINTSGIPNNASFYVSTLVHEASHMMSYYQNDVLRGKTVNGWFEETSAMMGEDIVSPTVNNGINKIATVRIPGHLLTGGNLSLNNWSFLSGDHYDMGGAFGGFLNRQYGTNIYKQSFTSCTTGTAKTDSYACLNSVIVNNGGIGVKEEMSRFGASAYARLAPTALPLGFGYPSKASGAYTIGAVDLSPMNVSSPLAVGAYKSMSQTYVNETIAAGKTRYIRNNVVVPAGTSLIVVIKD